MAKNGIKYAFIFSITISPCFLHVRFSVLQPASRLTAVCACLSVWGLGMGVFRGDSHLYMCVFVCVCVWGFSGSQSLGRFWCAKLFSLYIGINKLVWGNFGRDFTWVGVAFSSLIDW